MNCKYCNAAMAEEEKICPACGKEQETAEETVATEEVVAVEETVTAEEVAAVEETAAAEETASEAAPAKVSASDAEESVRSERPRPVPAGSFALLSSLLTPV